MAHTFVNLGFEEGDFVPGNAVGWTATVQASNFEIANFAPYGEGATPLEGFESGWANGMFVLVPADLEFRLFGGQTFEGYEDGWQNDNFVVALGPLDGAEYSSLLLPFEDFEQEWMSNEDFIFVFGGGDTEVGQFLPGPQGFEPFETDWNNNSFTFVLGAVDPHLDSDTGNPFENFEGTWTNMTSFP